jgi:hypothetical protein
MKTVYRYFMTSLIMCILSWLIAVFAFVVDGMRLDRSTSDNMDRLVELARGI